jgi:BirA family biotin operon repressor/biotin-[acetyl-CoA-carboxylase] ligase
VSDRPRADDSPALAAPFLSSGRDDLGAYCAGCTGWPPGWSVHFAPEIDSTQDAIRAAAAEGAPHGTVWTTDFQRAGRGRRGRTWEAPPSTSLLLSVLLRNAPLAPFVQTALCTLALCHVLEGRGLGPRIKWPNDVLLADRKVAGVLTERVSGAGPAYQIVGIGLNVNYGARRDALPPGATSLDWQTGRAMPRGPLLAELLAELAHLTSQLSGVWEARYYGEWLRRLWRRRQMVRLALGDESQEGLVEGVALDGALLLRLPTGELRRITVGEVLL